MQVMKLKDQHTTHENTGHEDCGRTNLQDMKKRDNARSKICTSCCRPGITVKGALKKRSAFN